MLKLARPRFLSATAVVLAIFACLAVADIVRMMFNSLLMIGFFAIVMGIVCGFILRKIIRKE